MNSSPQIDAPPVHRGSLFLEGCLFVAAWFSLSGWILSLLGWLNRGGYLVSAILGSIALGLWLHSLRGRSKGIRRPVWRPWQRRIRRPLPALFLVLFTLAALGGALHPPNNFDALTYRLPQVLHWLDAGRWHWIAASDATLNITPPGYGWLMAPLLALTQSDRGFFLPNIIAFALLPGLFFGVARGCGIRRRVAWHWMWILPSGYCFAMQAGGIANDLLPAAYLLAAVFLALRARRTRAVRDAWLSILAAALATGVKIVVLPLGLPWLVAIAPSWRLMARRPLGTALVVLVGVAVSFLPSAFLNAKHAGDWAGDPVNSLRLRIDRPLYGIAANALQVVTANVAPPICPFSSAANVQFDKFRESPLGKAIRAHYPRFDLRWFELAAEDGAGIGLGIVVLAGASLAASAVIRARRPEDRSNAAKRGRAVAPRSPGRSGDTPGRRGAASPPDPPDPTDPLALMICAAGLVAAAAYAAKMGSEAAPRLMAAYYPFLLLPVLRLSANEDLTRSRWWRVLAFVCAASIVPTLVLTPARPLWPAQTFLTNLAERHPESPFLRRSKLVYETFATRHDYLAALKKHIPAHARIVGFVPTGNDLESSLWRPFGQRRVVVVLKPTRSDPAVRQLSGSVVISSRRGLFEHFQMTAEEFAAAIGGRVIAGETLTLKAVVGPEPFCVIAVE